MPDIKMPDAKMPESPAQSSQSKGFPGMSLKSLRHHYSLIPLIVAVGIGAVGGAAYLARLALRNPDVSWDKKNNPLPYTKMKPTDQYKFFAITHDYSKLKKPEDRPDI